MRVLICGARDFEDVNAIRKVIEKLKEKDTVIHGAARGADTIAGELAETRGLKVRAFPADWNLYGRAAGSIRNMKMLRWGKPDIVYAFYTDKSKSKGTANMVREARKEGVKVVENK